MTRGIWTRETVALLLMASYFPLALFWLWFGGGDAAARLGLSALVVFVWHLIFMLARAQPPSLAAATTALAIAVLAPEELGIFKLVLGISFGVVMGELVFGGWGRNVVNPAAVALSFLGFGFPGYPWPSFVDPVLWAAAPAALIGVVAGVMPVAVIAGAMVVAAIAVVGSMLPETIWPVAGIVLVLLVADPVTSAATTVARWMHGGLYAGMVALFASHWSDAAPVQIAVASAFLASLAAPLLDEAALALWIFQRRRRHGRS